MFTHTEISEQLILLYKEHRNEFIWWVQKTYACTDADAKDALQEALIELYTKSLNSSEFKGKSSLKTYLFSAGKYKLLNNQRKTSRQVTLEYIDGTNVVEPSEDNINNSYSKQHDEELVNTYLNLQCENCQKVLRSFYIEGKDMTTIAKEMGYKNADVAKKKKYECFKKLAQMMKKNLTILVF